MTQTVYHLDPPRRRVVLGAIREACRKTGWDLLAAHVRSDHVHVLVDSEDALPHRVMSVFKANASRDLTAADLDGRMCRRWARHGSTVPIQGDIERALGYVADRQGEPMELFVKQQR